MANYMVGYDVGKQVDPSACVVVERIVRYVQTDGRTSENTLEEVGPKLESFYRVVHVQELKHTPYDAQIDFLSALMSKPELRDDAALVYDASGVGSAFGDMVQAAYREGRLGRCFWPHGATIVAGDGRPGDALGYTQPTVKKVDLVARLRVLLDEKRFQVPVGIYGGEQLLKELRAFTAKANASGRWTYENATAAIHDDLVIATMFAVYFQNWNAFPRCLENGVVCEQGSTAFGRYA